MSKYRQKKQHTILGTDQVVQLWGMTGEDFGDFLSLQSAQEGEGAEEEGDGTLDAMAELAEAKVVSKFVYDAEGKGLEFKDALEVVTELDRAQWCDLASEILVMSGYTQGARSNADRFPDGGGEA